MYISIAVPRHRKRDARPAIQVTGPPAPECSEHDTLRFGEFYIGEGYRGQGIGTLLLCQVLERCDELNQRTRLE
ncbi:GNAT family N-acetyltransferase [Halomonas sp. WWR20]